MSKRSFLSILHEALWELFNLKFSIGISAQNSTSHVGNTFHLFILELHRICYLGRGF